MSFRDNLQHLRAERGMTQEQLAMLVGVSRQSVTKWEAERAYPEMDKLLELCKIFDCSLDDLVQGDLTTRPLPGATDGRAQAATRAATADTVGYEDRMRTHALRIAAGVACCVAGAGVGMLVDGFLAYEVLNDIAILTGVLAMVLVGLAFIIPEAAAHRAFKREHPFIIDFFSADDRSRYARRRAWGICCGIALVFAGVLVGSAADGAGAGYVLGRTVSAVEMLGGAMMLLIAAGVGIIVHASILGDVPQIDEYNVDALLDLPEDEADALIDELDPKQRARLAAKRRSARITGAACGIIMLLATVVALYLLFVPQHEYFWVPWMLGGVLCGVAAIAAELYVGRAGR